MRSIVTFRSRAFNTTEPREHFINPECFGDDVAHWMMRELRARGVECASQPGQEDFGWYFTYRVEGVSHAFVIGFRPDDETWIGWLERHRGPIGSLILGRRRGVRPAASHAIHTVLSESAEIHDIRWHDQMEFDQGQEDTGATEP